MKELRLLLISLIVGTLVLSCQSLPSQTNGELPRLKLEHGWSPTYMVPLNGREEMVKCMTTEDIDKLTNYLLVLEAQTGIK